MKNLFLLLFVSFFFEFKANAQTHSIIIKGGHDIDPKNNINEVMDIAIDDDKIVRVAENIDAKSAKQVVHAEGLYVTPELIDI
ncbi:hypothetical protein [Daejeonella sp.]|uniref:hypothetical protein n=1 Tax=Daejeonella sp. TaxID=2805397 RepID=UPI0030C11551